MLAEPKCYTRRCKHFIGVKNDGDEATERVYCRAFPDKIPDEIAYGNNPHKEVHPDQDNEITFEKEK